MSLPALPEVAEIERRLQQIFPEGSTNRGYCIREMAAKTVFTMLYLGAVEGSGAWLAPKQVYHMSDRQALLTADEDRNGYTRDSMKPGFSTGFKRWYADNSREPIRDETLRDGLVRNGAVKTRPGVPTTSRFALESAFAALFDPTSSGVELEEKIAVWQKSHLSPGALARVEIIRRGGVASKDKILVTLPSGEARIMEAGLSSVITKNVVEEFARRFLRQPAVIWISESGNKVVHRDDALAQRIGLAISPAKMLPDVILADVGAGELYLVFVEIVATSGEVTESRRQALLEIATEGGYDANHVRFVTAFMDRDSDVFRRSIPRLTWGSFAWFASEPDHLISLNGATMGAVNSLSDKMKK